MVTALLAVELLVTRAMAWEERGPEGVPTGRILEVSERFERVAPDWGRVFAETPSADLGYVARGTAAEIREQMQLGTPEAQALAQPGMLGELGITLQDVLDTLDFVADTAEEDRGSSYKRLEDPRWLAENFEVYRWIPDRQAAAERKVTLADDRIRLTKYLVFQVDGSTTRREPYTTALYALPRDEQQGGPPETRMKYTRLDVYAGVFEPGGEAEGAAEPIVWLTREHANQAVMQGSIEVATVLDPAAAPMDPAAAPGGTSEKLVRMFNVHENNGIPYDPAIKDGNLQRRFWYFREVQGILGVEQIPLRPGAAVAGDIFNVGLGKLIALTWEGPSGMDGVGAGRTGPGTELRLVLLSDTGGAFQPNLFQLDWLAGSFPTREAFEAWEKTMPSRVHASVLVKKRPMAREPEP